MFNAGDHDPVIAGVFVELIGSGLNVEPEQIGATWLKVGVVSGLTVIVIVAFEAHCPFVGVKVYVFVEVLIKAGDHVPVIEGVFVELIGSGLNVKPEQIGATWLKVGVVRGFTVIVIVVFEAHWPAVGVKVYVVVAELFNAGDHVPVIAGVFVELIGSGLNVEPEQIGVTWLKVGVVRGFTVIVIVVFEAHWPAVGVKVYVVVAELFNAGDHVPVIAGVFVELIGIGLNVEPEQIGATWIKVGVVSGFTVIVIVAVEAHWPFVGVKVYVVVEVLIKAGDHVPVIAGVFVELIGSGLNVEPEQIGATWLKVGVVSGFTVIVIVAFEAHCPAVAVNV